MKLEDLKIYDKAHKLAVNIHKMSLTLPSFEMYEEGSQIRRSSKSVSSQIVEGYSLRNYKNEYIHYLNRAYASNRETKEHLDLLFETKSLKNEEMYKDFSDEITDLSKMIYSFINSVEKDHKLPKLKKISA
ncbi:MAG: four helix bundle protein [Candidatus Omnitrophota bacterium]